LSAVSQWRFCGAGRGP